MNEHFLLMALQGPIFPEPHGRNSKFARPIAARHVSHRLPIGGGPLDALGAAGAGLCSYGRFSIFQRSVSVSPAPRAEGTARNRAGHHVCLGPKP